MGLGKNGNGKKYRERNGQKRKQIPTNKENE